MTCSVILFLETADSYIEHAFDRVTNHSFLNTGLINLNTTYKGINIYLFWNMTKTPVGLVHIKAV